MSSKSQKFNMEILLQIARSTGWVSVVYFIGLFFMLPIRLLMLYSGDQFLDERKMNTLFQYNFTFQIGAIIIVPVILAVFLFRFLHVKQAVDMIHSLPLKRNRIFHHYALTGMLFLIVPVAINALLVYILHGTLGLESIYSTEDIFYWAGTTIVMTLLLFAAAIFIGMMTGISAVQAVLAYVFLFFPVGIMLLVFNNLRIFLYGFPSNYLLTRDLEKMSPITFAGGLESRVFHWNEAIIYMVLTIILYVASLFFYKKRKLEAASEAIAFAKLRSVFKYGAAFCTMLLGGAYFADVSYTSFGWTLFGYAVGAVFGYYAAEMVLHKTWRVFAASRLKGLLVFTAISAIGLIMVQNLGIYENHLPKKDEIASVIVTNNPNYYLNQTEISDGYVPARPLKEPENIAAVIKLHGQLLADKKINQNRSSDRSQIYYLNYQLKNGRHLIREYKLNERLYEDFLKPIYEAKEYKLAMNEIFRLQENKVKTININADGPVFKMVTISKPEEIHQALDALKKDVLSESYEDQIYYEGKGPVLEIWSGKDQFSNIQLRQNYQHFALWLRHKGWLEQAAVTAADIDHVLVTQADIPSNTEDFKQVIEKSGDALKFSNQEQIKELLAEASPNYQQEYKAVFYYKTARYSQVMFFDEAHAPEFLKKAFKK